MGAVLGALGGLLLGSIGSALKYQSTKETNDTNSAIAEQNLAFEKENLQYQKDLQQQIFQREDSSYQRAIADLKQAGLNPALAYQNGGSASGAAIQTSAPQLNYQYKSPLGSYSHMFDSLQQQAQTTALAYEKLALEKDLVASQVDANQAKAVSDLSDAAKTDEERLTVQPYLNNFTKKLAFEMENEKTKTASQVGLQSAQKELTKAQTKNTVERTLTEVFMRNEKFKNLSADTQNKLAEKAIKDAELEWKELDVRQKRAEVQRIERYGFDAKSELGKELQDYNMLNLRQKGDFSTMWIIERASRLLRFSL